MWPSFVAHDVDLTNGNTLALPARAACYARIETPGQLAELAAAPEFRSMPHFVLGGGSNLVLSGDFGGLVMPMAIAGRARVGEDDSAWIVRAGAGENWHDFVQWTLAQGWPGLENLSLIPGTVGAAPVQNIGAYGVEAADRFHALEAFDTRSGETVRLDRAACRFAYRDSVFKQQGGGLDGHLIVMAVEFRLPKAWQPSIRYADLARALESRGVTAPTAHDVAEAVIAVRREKLPDPAVCPNAGSFFHNPVLAAGEAQALLARFPGLPHYPQPDGRIKLAAGWLIEHAGWKGRNLGPVGMYEKQALVLVNRGGASGRDVAALMRAVQRDVADRFGVALTPEPVWI